MICLTAVTGSAAAAEAGSELVLTAPDASPTAKVSGNVVDRMPVEALFPQDGTVARLYGTARQTRCDGSPATVAQLAQVVAEADDLLLAMENDQAANVLADAREKLVCATEIVPTELLSDLFLKSGLARSFAGEAEAAVADFAQALAVDPDRNWDASYPPAVYLQYLEAMEQFYGSEPVFLRVLRRPEEVFTAVLDGRELAQDSARKISPGNHFLQLQAPDGSLSTFGFGVELGGDVLLATDAAMAGEIAQGPYSEQGEAVRQVLGEAAELNGVSAIQIVTAKSLYRFVPGSGLFKVLREPVPPAVRLRRTGLGLSVSGGVLFGTGLALWMGTGLGEQPHPLDPAYLPLFRVNGLGGLSMFLGAGLLTVGVPLAVAAKRSVRGTKLEGKLAFSIDAGPGRFGIVLWGRM